MFTTFKKQVAANFEALVAGSPTLFYVTIDRDRIFREYLEGFTDPAVKQEHTCNCCQSFMRQWGGIVAIKDNKMVSIWDGIAIPEYESAAARLSAYIHSLPITDVFLSDQRTIGTDKNYDSKLKINWEHLCLSVPSKFVTGSGGLAAILGTKREDFSVLQRGLNELRLDATEAVLDLISQGSLYRGNEHENTLKTFHALQVAYSKLKDDREKTNFAWVASTSNIQAVTRVRNTSIGTLLIDISDGVDLDVAVTKFERMVAPTNYKRPTSLVTPKMVDAAKQTIKELGFETALERRFAEMRDVSASNTLFVFRRTSIGDVFDEIAKETEVNPKTLSKVEEVHITDFVQNILPRTSSVELLLENRHLGNFVSLITASDPQAAPLFKWDNPFSWSYTGGITDKIKERVKEAGGNVDGALRISLSWHNYDDLDLHVTEPNGNIICYHNRISRTGGNLDVDMNAGGGTSRTPVENIVWKTLPPSGRYIAHVHNFCPRERSNLGFTVQIEAHGQTFEFQYQDNRTMKKNIEFAVTPDSIEFPDGTSSRMVSREKWGLRTNQFHQVNLLTTSPNHWNGAVGNKHFFFFLDGAISDEQPRPIYNEFLKTDLDKHRKVFEVLGGKLKVEPSSNQLSGVGFSDTQRSSAFLRLKGSFTRTIKVTF